MSTKARIFDLLHTHGRPEDDDAFLKLSIPYDGCINERIVISQYLKRYFCEHYPVSPDKVRVIYNGIDPDTLQAHIDPDNGRRIIGLGDGERALTYLGRLQADKSPERLVVLASEIRETLQSSNTCLHIFGEGELEPGLRDQARELGVLDTVVRFHPFSDRPLDICAASTYTILTSDLEGIPMSVLESMLAGTPVIAPAVGGLPEIFADGREGFLADFGLPDEAARIAALNKALVRALDLNERSYKTMRNQAHAKVLSTFTTMGQQYRELFDEEAEYRGKR